MRRTAREARRLRLATEILFAYLHARRAMRRAPLASVVAELRKPPRRRPARRAQGSLAVARGLGGGAASARRPRGARRAGPRAAARRGLPRRSWAPARPRPATTRAVRPRRPRWPRLLSDR